MLHVDLRGCGASWFAYVDGEQVGGPYHGMNTAATAARALEQKLKVRKERPCLCCGRAIMSEGPHHRLCAACRAKG
ncbi:hypothetical protein EBL89_03690 [Cereibacter sphaeroides]|uniref:hypothetical protein n=1 Tax=Cereibacter sphaeroides TaxID=1063 RepID=UPI000F522FF8|nr:hypothetical protein [Cereibacter sphaeroides]AZB54468.1 hypothetical protein EBL89_03690 [Cereibacter sphaeroides]